MKFHFLQALRAIAAWLVVADHALLDVTRSELRSPATHIAWASGNMGVYVFFTISGFIMVHICWDDFGRRGAAANFLRRRITRIVPLYWLATIAALAFHKVSATHGAHAGWSELVRSLLFMPYRDEDHGWTPILPQGWTLNYEMMFYAIFAVALAFRRQVGLPAIAGALVILTLVASFLSNGVAVYLSSPIVLWFVLGIGFAVFWRWQGLEEPLGLATSAKLLEPFGDASYSTYLVHGLVLTMLLRIWVTRLGAPSACFVAVGFALATVAGLAVHVVIEKPILRIVTSLWRPISTQVSAPSATVRISQ
jgi:exopolysaccharide production protein ExoZ